MPVPKLPHYTITGIKRWSCQQQDLPSASKIKALHIYDFDNTLFKSPLPNPRLWNAYTVSRLQNQDVFANGGWWHDERVLKATGRGFDVEELHAWSGWWNEQIAELVRLSAQQQDILSVLLTGRGERQFADLIRRMVGSKGLEFNLICLKPEAGPKGQRFSSTMQFKQALIQDLLFTYNEANSIKIYEDRPKQTKGFRDFLHNLITITFPDLGRKPLEAEVIQVADQATTLDPVTETAVVQSLINTHNAQLPLLSRALQIKRSVYYTAYLLNPSDTAKLLDLVKVPPNLVESEIKYLANSIIFAFGSADSNTLARVGGIGAKQTWQVTGFSFFQSSIWAVRVVPVPPSSHTHTLQQPPSIVLATYKNTKPDLAKNIKTWQPIPVDKQYILQTSVAEKVQLRIESVSDDTETTFLSERRGIKRRYSPNYGSNPNMALSRPGNGYGNENERPESYAVKHGISQNKSSGIARGKGGPLAPNGPKQTHQGKGARQRRSTRKPHTSLDDMSGVNSRYTSHQTESGFESQSRMETGGFPKGNAAGLPYEQ